MTGVNFQNNLEKILPTPRKISVMTEILHPLTPVERKGTSDVARLSFDE